MRKIVMFFSTALLCSILVTSCGKITDKPSSSSSIQTVETSQNPKQESSIEESLETPTPTTASFNAKQGYGDVHREIKVLGLKEYKKIKGEKYTDKAEKGKSYLVLFLKIHNISIQTDYFHPDYLTAQVDGKKISHTFLLNDPEGYPTIFNNTKSESTSAGFIVWEVPDNWKQIKIKYTGWKGMDGLTLNCTLTPKDLSVPEKYSTMDYN